MLDWSYVIVSLETCPSLLSDRCDQELDILEKSCQTGKTKKFKHLQVFHLTRSFWRFLVAADTQNIIYPMWLLPMKSWYWERWGSAKHSVNMLGYVEIKHEIKHQTEPFCFYFTTCWPKKPVFSRQISRLMKFVISIPL